ncbi:lysophospholipid acyltransferase family protein [Chitinimonas sp. BJYL2]|uniref:lysophospholipid acyltransferase family protein n=1 Tax=Chitinimonas sp. BJYL2 TaxID=2976696 RepID=UPI0022B3B432|nr:lysophospholipid acyltransferase family protein [Chitinimonas sp. BJYL2]
MLTLLLKCLARLPLFMLHGMGALVGWLVWRADKRYRQQLSHNLRQADAQNYNRLLSRSIVQHGKGAFELLAAWGLPSDRVCRLVRHCEGWEHAEAALAAQRPIIFVTPHLGGFDIAGRYVSSRLPFPLTAMYRPPKLSWLEPLMQAGRMRDNAKTAPATAAGVRLLMKALKQGEATVILPDQAPGAGEGVWAPFFGKPAYTMTLLPRLAQATNAAVLFFYAERLDWGRGFRVHIEPMTSEFSGDKDADARLLNQHVEKLIRRSPDQYLWSYNRYKQPAGASAPLGEQA